MSATSVKSASKNNDSPDRTGTGFNFKTKIGGSEHDRNREGRNNKIRPRRAEGDQENEGLSSSQPRKSFSAEGAERFIFRMGSMGAEKTRDENIYRDREDQDRDSWWCRSWQKLIAQCYYWKARPRQIGKLAFHTLSMPTY